MPTIAIPTSVASSYDGKPLYHRNGIGWKKRRRFVAM